MKVLATAFQKSWWGKILLYHDTEPVEFFGAVTKILLGVWLFTPYDSLGASLALSSFTILPEWVWGSIFLVGGATRMWFLRSGNIPVRRTLSLIAFLVWFSLAFAFIWNNPRAVAWALFMQLALGQAWCCVRLKSLLE